MNRQLKIKLKEFIRDKRAFYSFVILFGAFLFTLPAEFVCNDRPLVMSVDGKWYFPVMVRYTEVDFGGTMTTEPDYRSAYFAELIGGAGAEAGSDGLSLDDFEENSDELDLSDFEDEVEEPAVATQPQESRQVDSFASEEVQTGRKHWELWPPIRYDYKHIPTESKTGVVVLASPYKSESYREGELVESSWIDGHYLGTDDRGRDVLARLIYGFRISLIFGLFLAISGSVMGTLLGGIQGYFGGWVDLLGQRFSEMWGAIPRLYILIILSSLLVPSISLLFIILNLTAWMGIAAYIRAECLRTRNQPFVKAAKALGVSDTGIMRKHILPNSLTPIITFFPFEVTAGILALVSLDYLGLGVPSPAPSLGELLAQGKNNLQAPWIILSTFSVLTGTLILLTFVGEGIRNAFDPKRVT